MGLAWGFGFFFTQHLFAQNKQDIKPLSILFSGLFVSSFVGAKVFFLWFSAGNKITQYFYANYFWLGGGFVFYGGLIFGLLFFLIYSFYFKKFNFKNSYLLLPGLIFGHAIGRVGCFLTGCCFGSVSSLPWAVKMSNEWRHPVQLYEAISLMCLGFYILHLINSKKRNSIIIINYFIIYASLRFVLEFFRGDTIRGITENNLSTSQFVSLALILITLAYLIYDRKKGNVI
jgi:phosphatidylglycerol:prolipoprotein diacylglycerol transferase